MRRKLAAGNWKMNGTGDSLSGVAALIAAHPAPGVDLVICPPATLIARMAAMAAGHPLAIGGQDCHPAESGAHTGDVSALQLLDAGAQMVILGHSERRADHAETDALVAAKARAVHAAGLTAIICLGETRAQRDAGETLAIVARQLATSVPDGATAANTVIAYEPVWAIGTGLVPTLPQIAEVHAALRADLVTRFGPEGAGIRLLMWSFVGNKGNDQWLWLVM
ncbi:MAG: triose-phosphate isomerase, partial [Rubellimicrobium sp.]|nr:triose-phosphate isomerase [Rubellimicrobium sp.]